MPLLLVYVLTDVYCDWGATIGSYRGALLCSFDAPSVLPRCSLVKWPCSLSWLPFDKSIVTSTLLVLPIPQHRVIKQLMGRRTPKPPTLRHLLYPIACTIAKILYTKMFLSFEFCYARAQSSKVKYYNGWGIERHSIPYPSTKMRLALNVPNFSIKRIKQALSRPLQSHKNHESFVRKSSRRMPQLSSPVLIYLLCQTLLLKASYTLQDTPAASTGGN